MLKFPKVIKSYLKLLVTLN